MIGRVRILVVGYRKFSELINVLLPEFEQDAEVTIVESIASGNTDYSDLVEKHRPDVIISAGANAAYLRSTLAVPVLSQPVTDTDVLEALAKARKLSRRVHIFTYADKSGPSHRFLASLPELCDLELCHHSYSTADEANESLLLAIADEDPKVIVGPSYTCGLAEQRGIPAIIMYSRDSAREMLRRAIDAGRSAQSARAVARGDRPQRFIVHSSRMERVAALARTYARGRASVLLEGESGTGKEHIAREIHRLSDYADGPLVAVNCSSIPHELFESELFGYVEGAFTSSRRGGRIGLMEQANGGALFLDEIGEMPPQQQIKLLRALQERRIRPVGGNREIDVDFKLIAATNRDLQDAVDQGEFRDDLFYRLNVFNLRLPPLRQRKEEVPAIARHYVAHYAAEYDVAVPVDAVLDLVEPLFDAYHWPGNIRELQNFTERLVVNCGKAAHVSLSRNEVLDILPELTRQDQGYASGALKDLEASAIVRAMEKFGGDRQQVAAYLGISPTTLWRRLKKLEVSETKRLA
ncbi:sigma 54-interacting transcriptional regulator [Pseudohaliea rubra]|uniref:Response regulatory protein n=1 Tax=Pseudohaliea rubra DSM 19751 TaxID=1265313 RepID=A0A095X0S4_9GAMM|nr:sigma 54-interacting transcriptional regulator [Pseudohaliea rubra]KGE04499.1 Response regulatory protein [Pseudohaliea rubra DSM 19751]